MELQLIISQHGRLASRMEPFLHPQKKTYAVNIQEIQPLIAICLID